MHITIKKLVRVNNIVRAKREWFNAGGARVFATINTPNPIK
jgi:hypothetical protein